MRKLAVSRRFHVQCFASGGSITRMHVAKVNHCAVLYQCLAFDDESGEVEMYIELDGVIRTLTVEAFFENLLGMAVRCRLIRSLAQSKKVLDNVKSLGGSMLTESGTGGCQADTVVPIMKPEHVPDERLLAERDKVKRFVDAVEKLAKTVPTKPIVQDGPRGAMYWRERLDACRGRLTEMEMEKGNTTKDASRFARDAFLDLKRQICAMDNAVNERTFKLFDLREAFNRHRDAAAKTGVRCCSWEQWTELPCDAEVQREVAALRIRLLELERTIETFGKCQPMDDVDDGEVLDDETGVLRAQCLKIESVCREYDAIESMYRLDGLRSVAFDLHMRLVGFDCRIRRAKECCARLEDLLRE